MAFALLCVVAMGWGISRLPRPTVVRETNVAFLAVLPNGDAAIRSDQEPRGGTFRPCRADIEGGVDVDGLLRQAVGYIAEYAIWEERGTCKSILEKDQGFWFLTAANNFTYRRVN